MRTRLAAALVAMCVCSSAVAGTPADPLALDDLLRSLDGLQATEGPRLHQTEDGYVRSIGAPRGAFFQVPASSLKSTPLGKAKAFVLGHAGAFGLPGTEGTLKEMRTTQAASSTYVRLQQTLGGLDVFGAQMIVQLNNSGQVVSVLSDILRHNPEALVLTPTVGSAAAAETAKREVAPLSKSTDALSAAAEGLLVYEPAVVGLTGPTQLVWDVTVASTTDPSLRQRVFVNAHDGTVAVRYPLVHDAKYRMIYDGENTYYLPGTLVRSEGDPPTDDEAVNLAYDYLGDTYDFYATRHARDSVDDEGMPMVATVNHGLNYENAFWNGYLNQMAFGEGFLVDDVTAHEVTHGVTAFSSQLIYLGESGAINESLSDMWGEFVDLTNGSGNDSPEVRWLVAEDSIVSAFRNMANPPEFGDPDRMGSANWVDPYWWDNDSGGVHTNSGVGNKLCYLLTDGDSFNGQTVRGMGIDSVAKLFYHVQTNLLTSSSDYHDLYAQLEQASIDFKYSFEDSLNLKAACLAVEIVPRTGDDGIEHFRATPWRKSNGDAAILLTWKRLTSRALKNFTLVRKTGSFPQGTSDGVVLLTDNSAASYVDESVNEGVEYFYALFADFATSLPDFAFRRAVAGGEAPNYLSEAFSTFKGNGFDLGYKQIFFSPTGDPVAAERSGRPAAYLDYSSYSATVTPDVLGFPVTRTSDEGDPIGMDDAYSLHLHEDGFIWLRVGTPIPFFGELYSVIGVASNGYILFSSTDFSFYTNFPSIDAHFDRPRISFLFSDLAPAIGGTAWLRSLGDRVVLTFEEMPEWGIYRDSAVPRNSVQVELFYSGHIRFTYLDVTVEEAIVGLSDGNGPPPKPSDYIAGPNVESVLTDLSELELPPALSINPTPIQVAMAQDLVSFEVTATATGDEPVSFRASWDRSNTVPFSDDGQRTGHFEWQTQVGDAGTYVVTVIASQGMHTASQNIYLYLLESYPKPAVENLRLSTGDPFEDPTADPRAVSVTARLRADYTYTHIQADDSTRLHAEGATLIEWFEHDVLMPSYTGARVVPASATQAGHIWHFTVTPVSAIGVEGDPTASPRVEVVKQPIVSAIMLDGEVVTRVDAAGGMILSLRGTYLDGDPKVFFNRVPATHVYSFGSNRVDVVVPRLAPGPVNIVINTEHGATILPPGALFLTEGLGTDEGEGEGEGESPAEGEGEGEEGGFVLPFSCAAPEHGQGAATDLLVLAGVLAALVLTPRKGRSSKS